MILKKNKNIFNEDLNYGQIKVKYKKSIGWDNLMSQILMIPYDTQSR